MERSRSYMKGYEEVESIEGVGGGNVYSVNGNYVLVEK